MYVQNCCEDRVGSLKVKSRVGVRNKMSGRVDRQVYKRYVYVEREMRSG